MPLPNVDYLSSGYNVYFGNPHTNKTGADPGFQEKIFNFTYLANRTTYDLRYLVPDRTTFKKNYGCYLHFKTKVIDDVKTFVDTLDVGFGLDASFKDPLSMENGTLSMNLGYHDLKNGIEY